MTKGDYRLHYDARRLDIDADIMEVLLDENKKSATVRSVFRTINIITCLSYGINSITDIAHYCNLDKSTIHRYLKALIESNVAMQDSYNHRYYLGLLIARLLSNPLSTHEYLIRCAIGEMKHLSDYTAESITLSILIGVEYLVLYEIPSKYDLRVVEERKKFGDVYPGAFGKILLSQLDDKQLKITLMNMDSLTNYSDSDNQELTRQLKRIKRQGYAVSIGERIKGGMCLASPINNYVLPAVISVIGLESRIKPKKTEFLNELVNSTSRISEMVDKVMKAQTGKAFD
jgi:IclR family KDG regulon transcriptional repressor